MPDEARVEERCARTLIDQEYSLAPVSCPRVVNAATQHGTWCSYVNLDCAPKRSVLLDHGVGDLQSVVVERRRAKKRHWKFAD